MDEAAAHILNENIWELEQAVEKGRGSRELRAALLRAQAQQIAYVEEKLGIPRERRSILRIREGARAGVLLVHGSTGDPSDLAGLTDAIHAAGYTAFAVRLPGHGLDESQLRSVPWQACREDLAKRYTMLTTAYPSVFVVGFSFGATLSLQIPLEPKPKGMVLIAPAIYPRLNFWQRVLISLGLDRWSFLRSQLGWDAELLEAMEGARASRDWVDVPIYAAIADDDERVDRSSLGWIKRHSKNKKSNILRYPAGGHLFHQGDRRREFHESVVEFLRGV